MGVGRAVLARLLGVVLLLLAAGCASTSTPIAQVPVPTATLAAPSTPLPFATLAPSVTLQPSATPTPLPSVTFTPTITPTPSETAIPVPPTPTLVPLSAAQRSTLFEQVWQTVRDKYVYTDYRGLDWQAVQAEFVPRVAAAESPAAFYALLHEMIDRLKDDHSRFESPQEVIEAQARFEGKLRYVGIGAIIRDVPEGGMIMQLAPDGPAAQAGLQSRDVILAINSIPFTDTVAFGDGGSIGAVRGTAGTSVRLTVRSPGGSSHEVTVTRQPIPGDSFPSVQGQRLPGTQVALLTINTFYTDDIDQTVRAELERLLADGPLDGLIIDVRDNGGGVIDLMLSTLGLFVNGGSDGSSKGRDGVEPLVIPRGKALAQLAHVPLVVLTGKDTVSAAEMFAAGLHDQGQARVIGTNSAGNTESLSPYALNDGSRLWLAGTVYIRPDGTPNEGQGIHPDRVVNAEWWRFAPTDDPQVRAAIEELGRHSSSFTTKRQRTQGAVIPLS